LEKELLILERRRIVLQNRDPEIEARAEQQRQEEEEAEWEAELQAMEPEKRAQAEAEVDAATEEYMRDIERSVDFYMKLEAMEPEKRAQLEAERDARLAAMEPEERAQLGVIDPEVLRTPWLAEQVEVTQHLEAVKRELIAREIQGVSKRRKRSKRNPTVKNRREYVQAQAQDGFDAPHICETLDMAHIDLPKGADWEKYRKSREPWADAYRLGGKKLQGRILTIFSKDKKA
jgi:hypothetical protein